MPRETPLLRRHLAHHIALLDLGQYVQAVHDLAEDRVLAVQERLRLQTDVELAVGAVRLGQAGHAYRPGAVLLRAELRRNRQARSARPIARGIPTLDEKLRDDAVEGQAVVESLFDEFHESRYGPGRRVRVKLEGELPAIRLDQDVRPPCMTRTEEADKTKEGSKPDTHPPSHTLRVRCATGPVCRRSRRSSRSARSAGHSGHAAHSQPCPPTPSPRRTSRRLSIEC